MNNASSSRSSDSKCFNCLRSGHMSRTAKAGHVVYPAVEGDKRTFAQRLTEEGSTKNFSDATTAIATNITQGGLQVVQIKLINRDLSLNVLAMCDSGSSISFVDKSVVSRPKSIPIIITSRDSWLTRCQD